MPNHCYNRVRLYSDKKEDIKKLLDIFESGTNPKNDKTVFGQIIPEPDWHNIPDENGDLPVKNDHKNKDGVSVWTSWDFPSGKNDDRWYNWRVHNWGTKWDCYDLSIEDEDENALELQFNTAWSPPEEIFRAIRDKYEDVSISWFYDEPGCELAGYL